MNWMLPEDRTPPVISAESHIRSSHGRAKIVRLPETCVIFEIGMALNWIESHFETTLLYDHLPCFLEDSRCISIQGHPGTCFTRGGYGAPAAVDTLETVRALGVRRVIIAGMCGGFSEDISVSDVVIPRRVKCEEGTSLHYFSGIDYAEPEPALFERARAHFASRFPLTTQPTVTCDAVYRQTYAKEAAWREVGCVGVDMESSALLAVARYHSLPAVSILLCSDRHPITEGSAAWNWGDANFEKARESFIRECVSFAIQ